MSTNVKDLLSTARAAVPAITRQKADDLIKNADALVLDVRDGPEVAASGKLKGALAISRGMLEFKADPAVPSHEPALRKDRPVLLYCASGGRSALAGKTLLDMGFTQVHNLGGFKELTDAGWPVEPA